MPRMHRNRVKKRRSPRTWIQLGFTALFNGYAAGFAKGTIFTGATKYACVPVLNCYSCPGALGSCPIGSLQAVIGGAKHQFSFYVLGTIMLFGIVLGRLVCGFLCPFGLVQDLLHKIPVRKWRVPKRVDKPMRFLKYVVLLVMVILLPMFATNALGTAPPFFCKYICPITVFLKPMSYFSLLRVRCDKEKCISCGKCKRVCPMDVDVTDNARNRKNGTECIHCMECVKNCPKGAL